MPNKGLKKIIRQKIAFIDAIPDTFINQTIRGAESPLFDVIVSQFLDKLEVKDGVILSSQNNYRIVGAIDKAWATFQLKNGIEIINAHISNFGTIVGNNIKYYQDILTKNKTFITKAKNITSVINRRLGINADGSLIKSGYMGGILEDVSVRNQIKEFSIRAVANGNGFDDTKANLAEFIKGNDEKLGVLRKYYRNIAYDTYKQIDSMQNKLFGEEFELTYFVYDGNIIKTTRKFCRTHVGLIFTNKQAEEWKDDPDLTAAPLNYEPLVDLGGYGCRHIIRYLTQEMAEDLDPTLKAIK